MKRPQEITAKLKVCDPELRLYVIELEKENLKLHKQKAKLHVQVVSQKNEIVALKKHPPGMKLRIQSFSDPHIKTLTDKELDKKIEAFECEIKSQK